MNNFIINFWYGKLPLWKSYWLIGELLNSLIILLIYNIEIRLFKNDLLYKQLPFLNFNSFNLISFQEKDHGDRDGSSLVEWVKKNLKQNNINSENIKIKLLCYPRILGYVFNPLSIFFVYDNQEQLVSILYEVKNTFGEQHTYIFKVKKNNILQHSCSKKFHVSPTEIAYIGDDLNDLVFLTKKAKYLALIDEIESLRKKSAPILVGTVSVESSEQVSKNLDASDDGAKHASQPWEDEREKDTQ